MRLVAAVAISTIGGVGMWSVVVALPAVQAEFGVHRGDAALPYTLVMMGLVVGGVAMGRLADRFGIVLPAAIGAVALGLGYVGAAFAESIWQFALVHGLLIGLLGTSATFGPVIADISLWFVRRRGAAVAIVACGSYLAGASWPPVIHHFVETVGWRQTHIGIGIFCAVTLLPLAFAMRRRAPVLRAAAPQAAASAGRGTLAGFPPLALQALLMLAGLACCVAMSMPQVHIVAYCGDLGYGTGRGAEMLSLMLGAGVVSRLVFGWVADRIGAVPTLLIGSALQALSLLLFLPFDGLGALYLLSTLFGLFQGGIVPAYAMIVRENFPAGQVGTRVNLVLSSTLAGMALGGWLSGAIFDLTLSYEAAFLNGFLWNLANLAIVAVLLRHWLRRGPATGVAHASSGSA
ncbi:MAG: MFS transporter [Alphaproteobacteria bacterium]